MTIVLEDMWVRHIERFSERLRGRLYAALIAYLNAGTEIPENLMPYIGIILDLMEQQGIKPGQSAEQPPVDQSEQAYLRQFMEESAPGYVHRYEIESQDLDQVVNSIYAYWQEPTPHGGHPLRHRDADHFWERMSQALQLELTSRGVRSRSA
ncbi:MAG: hypothetical protein K2M61_02935 [Muribaculaceae bacterium]|nr:hypothetical protein [Muribaculaceae bacterium]